MKSQITRRLCNGELKYHDCITVAPRTNHQQRDNSPRTGTSHPQLNLARSWFTWRALREKTEKTEKKTDTGRVG